MPPERRRSPLGPSSCSSPGRSRRPASPPPPPGSASPGGTRPRRACCSRTATAATLTLHLDHERLLCLVADGGGGGHPEEVPAEHALSGAGGRGLRIVEALSDAWGWGAGTEGVTAWFSVARRSVAARGRRAPARGRASPP
jgi:hypothetical protein